MDSRAEASLPLLESEQPLDFTAAPNTDQPRTKDEHECAAEPPVLDLSCKKNASASHPKCLAEKNTQASTVGKIDAEHSTETERKSPFTGRSYMVTPPSEGDSPKKTKYEPIYNQINSTTSEMSTSVYPMMPIPLSIPVAGSPSSHPPLSSLVESNHRLLQTQPSSIQLQAALPDHHAIDSVAEPALSPDMGKKIPRPFKAYPKDPLSLTMGTPELICDQTSNEAYSEFRKRMLDSVKKTNEGINIKMRRTAKSPSLPTSTMDEKDAAYWERRRKNNEAAKRSRDARRAKEDEIAIRAAFLEQENIKLKYELVALRNETAKLRCMVYSN